MAIDNFQDRLVIVINVVAEGSQKRLADALGVQPSVVNGWLKRNSKPSSEQLARFTNLGINLNWLLTGEGKMLQTPKAPSMGEGPEDYEQVDRFIATELPEMLHNFDRLDDFDKRRVIHSIDALLKEKGMNYEKLFNK